MCDEGSLAVHAGDLCVVRSADCAGELAVRVTVPLADVYLEVLGGRCRPSTGGHSLHQERQVRASVSPATPSRNAASATRLPSKRQSFRVGLSVSDHTSPSVRY